MGKGEEKILYRHMADIMNMRSTQDPKRVYYVPGQKHCYQCRLWNGAFTVHTSRDEVLKSYPHIADELDEIK